MAPIKKEYIISFYVVLTLILSILGYSLSATNKLEYGLSGGLLGILLSIILWITWGSRNSY
jgi:hypothetical protein